MDSGLLSKRIPIKKKANPLTDLISVPKKFQESFSLKEEEIKSQFGDLRTPKKAEKLVETDSKNVDYHTISEIKKAVDETISNLKVLKNSIDTEKKNLLDVRKKIFSSPPKKDSEGVLRNSNLEIIKDQRQKIIRINPQEKQNETEIILLKKRVQQLEKMLQSQVSRSVSSSPRRSSSNRYSSRLVSREGSPNNSDNLEKIRNRISDIDKKISSTKYNGKKLFSSNVLNQNKQRDIEQILEENRELKKELERKNNQIQSLIDLNLDLEDQLNDIKYQNEKEFSMVERVSLNLKENLSRILGENEVSGF